MNVQEWLSATVDIPMEQRDEVAVALRFTKEYYDSEFYKDAFEEAGHFMQAEIAAGPAAALTYKVAVTAEVLMKIAVYGLPEELQKLIKKVKG